MVKLILDKALKNKNVTRYWLSQTTGVKYQIVDKYYKNHVVRYDSYLLSKFCDALECNISDIICYIPDEKN